MKKPIVVLIATFVSAVVTADEKLTWSANVGAEVGMGTPAYQTGELTLGQFELGDSAHLSLVGQASASWMPFENSDIELFASYRLGSPLDPIDGVRLGATVFKQNNHQVDVAVEELAFVYQVDRGWFAEAQYSLNYSYENQDWLFGVNLSNEAILKELAKTSKHNLWKARTNLYRFISLPSLWNSQLIVGGSAAISSPGHADYYFGVNEENQEQAGYQDMAHYDVGFAASASLNASWIVPISESWVFTTSLSNEFLSEDLANSPLMDDHSSLQTALGLRYVF